MSLSRKLVVSATLALVAAGATTAAHAGGVHWSIGINLPPAVGVVGGGPVYGYPPAPVYYAPPPVVVAPPVVYQPAPVYHYRPAPRVVYGPPVVYERWDGPPGHRHWDRRDRRDWRDGRDWRDDRGHGDPHRGWRHD